MSWGIKIIIAFAAFMIGMLAMVFYVFNLQMDLVEENYYEKEIKYQDHIDILTDTRDLGGKLKIQKEDGSLRLQFPENVTEPNGVISFYRPSDAKQDMKIKIQTENNLQNINTAMLRKGAWDVQVQWTDGNKKYFKTERIYIN